MGKHFPGRLVTECKIKVELWIVGLIWFPLICDCLSLLCTHFIDPQCRELQTGILRADQKVQIIKLQLTGQKQDSTQRHVAAVRP